MATQQDVGDEVREAAIRIPADWLMALLDLEGIRQIQRPDTLVSLTPDGLTLSGVELLVERRWVREPFWQRISESVTSGFIHKRTAVKITLRGDRREHQRRTAHPGR